MTEHPPQHSRHDRTLYSLATYQNGRAFKPAETQSATGLPVIKIAELNNGITETTGRCAGIVEAKHRVDRGDLLFAWSGSVGVHLYNGPTAALNQHIFKCTAVEDVDQRFLRYLLESQVPIFKGIVEDKRTTMGHVQVADLKRLKVPLPSLPTQAAVADVLCALDGHIQALQELQRTLSETVLAACGSAIEGRRGTETLSLSKAVRLVNGGAYTKGATGTGRMVVRIKELNSGPSETTVYNDIEVPPEKTVFPGDVLFAWSGSLGIWRWFGDEAIVNQHIFKVLEGEHPVWLGWVHINRELAAFREIAAGKATTMGHITKEHLERAQVPALATDEVSKVAQVVEPIWEHQLHAGRQLRALQELRAFLLPRLVSGDLAVSEGAPVLEAVS